MQWDAAAWLGLTVGGFGKVCARAAGIDQATPAMLGFDDYACDCIDGETMRAVVAWFNTPVYGAAYLDWVGLVPRHEDGLHVHFGGNEMYLKEVGMYPGDQGFPKVICLWSETEREGTSWGLMVYFRICKQHGRTDHDAQQWLCETVCNACCREFYADILGASQ